jgi:hypothetical protein
MINKQYDIFSQVKSQEIIVEYYFHEFQAKSHESH